MLLQLVRSVVVLLLLPVLTKWGYGMTHRQLVVLAFAGLRGEIEIGNKGDGERERDKRQTDRQTRELETDREGGERQREGGKGREREREVRAGGSIFGRRWQSAINRVLYVLF